MNFGGALECLKRGMKVQREGWVDTYLALQIPDEHSKMTSPYIYLNVMEESNVPWSPRQSDMLAEDWNLV
jgi:hypothetical protein